MKFETHRSMPLAEMPRVSRQQFCDKMDEILDRVSAEEIAFIKGWIDKNELRAAAEKCGKSVYGQHLKAVAEGKVRY